MGRYFRSGVGAPKADPRAVVLALHGFNDYSRAFAEPAQAFTAARIVTYAYDQRGFWKAPHKGAWSSVAAMTDGELEALRAERDALRDKFMRALAEAENARKRADKDRREAENYGGARFARDMLPVHDNLKRALETITDDLIADLAPLTFGEPVTHVYNPLRYAWSAHRQYLERWVGLPGHKDFRPTETT